MSIQNHDQDPVDRSTWCDFLGVDIAAGVLPRFDELLRVIRNNRQNLPICNNSNISSVDIDSTLEVLNSFRDMLARFNIKALLIELALVHDRLQEVPQPHPSNKSDDTQSFGSFAACYSSNPLPEELLKAYDDSIAMITNAGRGEAILGHDLAYLSPFFFIPNKPTDYKNGLEPTPTAACSAYRINEFPYNSKATKEISDPVHIPTQLLDALKKRFPDHSDNWIFALYPFRRPTLTAADAQFSQSQQHFQDAPGGILFVLCEISDGSVRSHVSQSAWAIHHLIDKALLLEARDSRRTRSREDTALLFHSLLRSLNELHGKAKIALGRDHEIASGLGRLDSLAKSARNATLINNLVQKPYNWDRAPVISICDLTSVVTELIMKAGLFPDQISVTLDASIKADTKILWCEDLIALTVPEITFNAKRYGNTSSSTKPLHCYISFASNGWIQADFQNPLPCDKNQAALEAIKRPTSYLGFLQLSYAAMAFQVPQPRYRLLTTEPDNNFSVVVAIGRQFIMEQSDAPS